jgi:hypothetical protein
LVLLIQRLYERPAKAVHQEIDVTSSPGSGMATQGLARVAHASGNAIDRHEQRIANVVVIAHFMHTPQQLDLHQIERIDVRIAHVDRAA